MFCLSGRLIEKAGNRKQSVNEVDGEPGSKRQAQAGAFHELLDGGKSESGCDAQYVRGFGGGERTKGFETLPLTMRVDEGKFGSGSGD
jgi:hypothetical protein